jgi:uncharacterized protein
MTPQERELLEGFLSNLEKMHATNVDTEAEALIRRAIYNQPQAPYLLVQQTLLQQIALRDAQAQITELQRQLEQVRGETGAPSGSFLGGAPRIGPDIRKGEGNATTASRAPASGAWNQPQTPAETAPSQGIGGTTSSGSGLSGFLRSAASTAAGVAGGTLLFQGIESLLARHGGVWGSGISTSGLPEVVENTTIINESGDSRLADSDDGRFVNVSSEDNYVDEDDADPDLDQWDDSSDDGDDSSWV